MTKKLRTYYDEHHIQRGQYKWLFIEKQVSKFEIKKTEIAALKSNV